MSSRRSKTARRQIPIVNAFPPIPGPVVPGVITGGAVVWPNPHPGPYFQGPYGPPYPILYDAPLLVPPPLFYPPVPFY